MTTLSIVIPALNEEDGIAAIIERTLAVEPMLAGAGVDKLELIVVDDGSTDRTAEIVEGYPQVKLIRHQANRGYGAAIKTGFRQATGEWLAFLDADGTYPPEAFPAMCLAGQEQGADLIIGSRMTGAESQMPLTRRVGNLFFAGLVSFVGNTTITDSASGQRVIRRAALPKLYPLPDGLNFTPVMSTRALHEDIKMIEVPIRYHERVGRSKLSVTRDGWRFLQSILWTGLLYNPVRLFGTIGGLGVLIALVIGAGLVLVRASGSTDIEPLGALVVVVAVVSAVVGISVFSFGTTINYLAGLMRGEKVRFGLFGKPILEPSLDHHFGWMGLLSALLGVGIGVASLILSLNGWELERLFFYLLGSAMLVVMGFQLMISWVLMRVLEILSERKQRAASDMGVELAADLAVPHEPAELYGRSSQDPELLPAARIPDLAEGPY
jgi:glycosyltransferase involved in cell wall biosynthesis